MSLIHKLELVPGVFVTKENEDFVDSEAEDLDCIGAVFKSDPSVIVLVRLEIDLEVVP